MSWRFPRLSRRGFLKASGATGAAGLGLLAPRILKSKAEDAPAVEDVSYSICNFCSSLCSVRVTSRTRNGIKRIVKLDGNPNSTLNRGKLCARGQAGLRQIYDTDRIKTPMIRVEGSKRGEFKFRPATWDEAYKYIDDKIKGGKIKPYEFTMVGGWTSCIFYMNWAVSFAMANEVPNIVASPMQHCVTTGHFGTDLVTGNFNIHDEILPDYDNARYVLLVLNNASIGAVSTCRMVRFANAKKNGAKVVVVDSRRSETASKADEWLQIRPGTDLDFLMAVLKTMLDEGLYDADFVKHHTNLPFLVRRDDEGEWHLVNDAEGRPRVMGEESGTIHTLPAVTNTNAVDVKGTNLTPVLTVPADTRLDGQTVMTVMQAQQVMLADCTPEAAERTSGIPADTVRRVAREFGTNRPAIIDPGWHGARFQTLMMLRRVAAMIQGLTGGIDAVGGWMNAGEFRSRALGMYKDQEAKRATAAPLQNMKGIPFAMFVIGAVSNGANFSHGRPGWAWAWAAQQKAEGKPFVALPVLADVGLRESVLGQVQWKGEPYRTRAILLNAANPVRHYYPDTYWKDMFASKNLEVVVAIDVLPSDTTPYADVLLPSSCYLERGEPTLYGNGSNPDLARTTRYPAIDPLYDCEEAPDILLKMTEFISGNSDKFIDTIDALAGIPADVVRQSYARRKDQVHARFSDACRDASFVDEARRLGVTVAQLDKVLREKGVYAEESHEELLKTAAMPRKVRVPTPSGRLEYFSPVMAGLRAAGARAPNFGALATHFAPDCRPGLDMAAPLDQDEFFFTYGKVPTVSYASTNGNNPVLAAINRFRGNVYTGIWIHPDRAGPLGIRDGDQITMTNVKSHQTTTGHAFITRMVHRDAIFLHSAFGTENPALTRAYGIGTATNKLIPHEVEPVVGGFRSQEFTIRVAKTAGKGGAA